LLLGWDPYAVAGIQAKTVPVEPLLDRIGIPYDKDRMYVPEPAGVAPTHEH
jgi:heterodisulfide reductase subunit B